MPNPPNCDADYSVDHSLHQGSRPTTRHIPELDGYRGIGVLVVVLFHFDLLKGGWLGVDLFFVLSGFLITRIIVHERANTGRINLRNFWRRRARRLLPALVVFLAGVALYLWWYPEKVALPTDVTAQMWATVFYVANWQTILSGSNYWTQYAVESPLRHMWSLSIEEQFYVVFPLAMTALFSITRRRLRVAWVLLGAAVVSWTTGVLILAATGNFERVYLGTDTRIGAVLLGAGVGYLTCVPSIRDRLVSTARLFVVPAFAVMIAAFVLVDGSTNWSPLRWLLMPGFEIAVVILLTAALANKGGAPVDTDSDPTRRADAVSTVGAMIQGVVASRPLVWLGGVSYGLYLWHIPVKLTVERAMRSSPRAIVVITAILISLAISALSLRFVERPIRTHGLKIAPRGALLGSAFLLVAGSLALSTSATAEARHHANRGGDEAMSIITDAPETDPTTTTTTEQPVGDESPGEQPPLIEETTTVPPPVGIQLPLPRPPDRQPRVLLFGDSLAYDLTKGFTSQAAKMGISASASSLVGCGLGGTRFEADGHPGLTGQDAVARCDAWIAKQASLVDRVKPDAVLVFRVGSRQPEPGSSWCDPTYLQWYTQALNDEIERLSSTGAAVVIAPLVYQHFGGTRSTESDDRTDCLNKTIAEVTSNNPKAASFPLDKWMCPDRDTCRVEEDGVTLRPDGLHFQGPGAVVASRWILGQIFQE
ncbi:MAG: acyltransferase [Microthrixaceae bacterium]|nr:acyltransferase [Microthrixaceae bacterium]